MVELSGIEEPNGYHNKHIQSSLCRNISTTDLKLMLFCSYRLLPIFVYFLTLPIEKKTKHK